MPLRALTVGKTEFKAVVPARRNSRSMTTVFPGASVTSCHKRSGLKQHELSISQSRGQKSEPWQQESAGPAPSGGEFPSWPLPACISQLMAPSSNFRAIAQHLPGSVLP